MTTPASPHESRWLERLAGLPFLSDKPEEDAESTLRALWYLATGERRSADAAREGTLPPLDDAATARLDELVGRRAAGTPLAHLTRRARFMSMELFAGPEALVPRRETELLAQAAIDCLRGTHGALVVDACTGSGNVALAIAHALPDARVHGADLDDDAVTLAHFNARHVGLHDRVHFAQGDLFAPFDDARFGSRVDLVACNPPYISSPKVGQMATEISAHEPALAFDGGPLGVSVLVRLIDEAPRLLRDGGWLVFEVGAGQGPSILRRLAHVPHYDDVEGLRDAHDVVRVVRARYRPAASLPVEAP